MMIPLDLTENYPTAVEVEQVQQSTSTNNCTPSTSRGNNCDDEESNHPNPQDDLPKKIAVEVTEILIENKGKVETK